LLLLVVESREEEFWFEWAKLPIGALPQCAKISSFKKTYHINPPKKNRAKLFFPHQSFEASMEER
jgi:hypothetical protein